MGPPLAAPPLSQRKGQTVPREGGEKDRGDLGPERARARLGAVLSSVTDSLRRPKYCLRQNAAAAGSVPDRIPGSRSVEDRTQ